MVSGQTGAPALVAKNSTRSVNAKPDQSVWLAFAGNPDSGSVNLPATVTFTYDANGNLTGEGRRALDSDYSQPGARLSASPSFRSGA